MTVGEPLTVTVKVSCARIRAGRDAKARAKRVEVNIANRALAMEKSQQRLEIAIDEVEEDM